MGGLPEPSAVITLNDGERGRNRTFNLLIKSQSDGPIPNRAKPYCFQMLTLTQARTEAKRKRYQKGP